VVRAYFMSLPGAQTARGQLRLPLPADPPASLGKRPGYAEGWVSVSGSFFRWHPGPRRSSHSGLFSAWASPHRLAWDGGVRDGYELLGGAYKGWLVFPGSNVTYREVTP
jgi:hypothetical protein